MLEVASRTPLSNERSAAIDGVYDAIIVKRLDGAVSSWNSGATRMFGYSAEEMVGQSIERIIPPDLLDEEREIISKLERGQHISHFETVRIAKDGRRLIVSVGISPIYDGGGAVIGATKIARDITERARSEQALREAAMRLATVANTAVDGLVLIDADGSILMFNRACERLFGYRAEEVIGKNVNCLMPAPYHEEHDRYLDNYRRTGERKIIGIGREVVGRRSDGTTFPMGLSVGEATEDGKVVFIGVIHDLTEQVKANTAIREAAKRLATVANTAVDGLVLIDADGSILMFNRACERLFGYRAEEVIGKNVKCLMPAPYHEEHDRYLNNYRQTGVRKIIGIGREVVGRRKDGTTFPMDLSVGEATQDGRVIFVGIIHDLTEHKQHESALISSLEELGRANEGLAHFAHAASHDLKEPLRMVEAFCGRLQTDYAHRLDARGVEYLSLAVAAASRMSHMLSDLADFERLAVNERGNWFDARAVVNDALANLADRIRDSGASIELGSLPQIYGNSTRFERLAQNLIVNALKYVAPGVAPNIAVNAEPEGEYWRFSVADNGIGIDPRFHDRIFEPFKRLHGKNRHDGSGLGLTICRKIVEGFGGTIAFLPREGGGSIFTFTVRQGNKETEGEIDDK